MKKQTLWMLIADMTNPHIHLAIPSVAWMAKEAGVSFECYLEAERDGKLFATSGSTVIGGSHHQQFNYLNSVFDVKYILLGETSVFRSSIKVFNSEILIETESLQILYEALLKVSDISKPECILFASDMGEISVVPSAGTIIKIENLEIGPYLYPEIYFRKALALPISMGNTIKKFSNTSDTAKKMYIYLSNKDIKSAGDCLDNAIEIDKIHDDDTYSTITVRIAERWKHKAKGVAFGDPAAILSMIPTLCREERIVLYGRLKRKPISQIKTAWYTEDTSEIVNVVSQYAEDIGNLVVVGRQTCDGDLFEWSKKGVCMKIMDPNRPAFPIVSTIKHTWANKGNIYEDEPDDGTLIRYAKENKILATLTWHSGEIAHNEAMINLFELSCMKGLKMGIGVHAARYETSPQLWELLSVPRESGGVKGLIEPVLHSGGLGVMAEVNCPAQKLAEHCKKAMDIIRGIAGEESLPKGYLTFMDTDLGTLEPGNSEIYKAIASCGLEYVVSSALPGRNKILFDIDGCKVLNQSSRTILNSSPFIRVTTVEDIPRSDSQFKPAWMIATLDAPVIAFNPYIWRSGSRFMKIVDWLLEAPNIINVTPHVISRYAKILKEQGFLPDIN